MTSRGEVLRAGWIPEGFSLASGDEERPWGARSPRYVAGRDREIWLTRILAGDTPVQQNAAGPGGRTTASIVHGRSATMTVAGRRVLIAWNEQPDVTVIVNTVGVGRHQAQRIADATVYHREDLGPAGSWTPCEPSLPAGARSRAEIMALAEGSKPEGKLVRLRDLKGMGVHDGIVGCMDAPCDPDIVVWAVLDHHMDLGHGPPDAPTRTGAGWSLLVRDAATGIVRSGLLSGLGPEPPFWGSLEDLAPRDDAAEPHRRAGRARG